MNIEVITDEEFQRRWNIWRSRWVRWARRGRKGAEPLYHFGTGYTGTDDEPDESGYWGRRLSACFTASIDGPHEPCEEKCLHDQVVAKFAEMMAGRQYTIYNVDV